MRKGGLYLAIGDSTTLWTPTATWNGANPGPYPQQLAAWIRSNYGGVQYVNQGFPGTTTEDWVKHNSTIMGANLEPDLVTISFGINDSYSSNAGGWGVISTATFQANIQKMISRFKQQNPSVVVILCTSPTINNTNNNGNMPDSNVTPYRNIMETVNWGTGVSVCQFETAWNQTSVSTYTNADGIHPNDAGHQALYNLLYPVVQANSAGWLATLGK